MIFSRFNIVQQFVYNNGYIKFRTMCSTFLSSLYQPPPPGTEVEFAQINSLETSFVQLKEAHRIGKDLNRENN